RAVDLNCGDMPCGLQGDLIHRVRGRSNAHALPNPAMRGYDTARRCEAQRSGNGPRPRQRLIAIIADIEARGRRCIDAGATTCPLRPRTIAIADARQIVEEQYRPS